jgi:hypothetical protein
MKLVILVAIRDWCGTGLHENRKDLTVMVLYFGDTDFWCSLELSHSSKLI